MISTKSRFKLLPEGTYTLTLSKRPKKVSDKDKGYEYIEMDFDALNEMGFSQPHREFFFLNEERLKQVLLALGGEEDEEGEVHLDEDDALEESFQARIEHLTVKGKQRAKIFKVLKKEGSKEEEPPF